MLSACATFLLTRIQPQKTVLVGIILIVCSWIILFAKSTSNQEETNFMLSTAMPSTEIIDTSSYADVTDYE
ncbi:unnamed protein product [Auanema sp. JU1783]|nr:unnamed protein product [Auanema sp. JU1783]